MRGGRLGVWKWDVRKLTEDGRQETEELEPRTGKNDFSFNTQNLYTRVRFRRLS